MSFQRLIHYGSNPLDLAGSLSDRAIAGCWFELRRQGGCGAGELRLRHGFLERGEIQIGDWVALSYDADDRWYLGRVVERRSDSPAGIRLRLEGMAAQLDTIFPGGFGSEADGVAPHRYGCSDLFPADPDAGHVNIDCVNRPEELVRLLLEQYIVGATNITFDPELIEDATAVAELIELKVRGTETATSLLRDLALRARNAAWGVDEYGRFFLLQQRADIAAEWREGRELVALRELSNEDLVFNRVLLAGGLVYADCPTPPCGTYRWQGNYLQPASRTAYGERRIRLSIPWIRTSADSQGFIREFFRVYAQPAPHYVAEVAGASTTIRPWLAGVRLVDRNGNELAAGQPEVVRVEFDHTPKLRISLGPLDPRELWTISAEGETWPIAPSDTPGYGGGPVDVTSDDSSESSEEEESSDDGYTDCHGCGSIARRWKITFSGIAAGTCAECALLNVEHVLERNFSYGYCRWRATSPACSGITIDFVRHWSVTQVLISRGGLYIAVYTLLAEDFDCHGPNTLPLVSTSLVCTNWPTSLVLEPAE